MKKSLHLGLSMLLAFLTNSALADNVNQGWNFTIPSDTSISLTTEGSNAGAPVDLPHTWNALDGQDGGNNYYRGPGWYSKTIEIPTDAAGKTAYLNFAAANMKTDVWIDGVFVGTHTGGHSRFMFDITPFIKPGKISRFDIKVDNSKSIIAPPLGGDFTFFGGITRDLSIDYLPALHIQPLKMVGTNSFLTEDISVASPGVFISQREISPEKGIIDVTLQWRNASKKAVKNGTVQFTLRDAEGVEVASETVKQRFNKNSEGTVTATLTLDNPHLWNGTIDPYRYTLDVDILAGGKSTHSKSIPVGLRSFEVSKTDGFILNGKKYPLRGIAIHDAYKDKGRAVSDADRKSDIDLMLETGANFLRLTHYPHAEYTYNYLDSLGIICWTEIPVVEQIALKENVGEFTQNCSQQLYEMIHQLQNHASVICWGLANEVRQAPGDDPVPVITHLNDLSHQLDATRPTTIAHNGWFDECSISDLVSFNIYNGWYNGTVDNFGGSCDWYHKHTPQPVGVSEYGAGANIHQHEYPAKRPATTGQWHPEEYQNLYHEAHLRQINERPWIWESSIWVGIDFASDHRAEGEQPGINDKGLITFDRQTKKDSYFLYKAAWNLNDPTLHINGRRYLDREGLIQPVRVYTNCPEVTLTVNGTTIRTAKTVNNVAAWDSIAMRPGNNVIKVSGRFDGAEVTDECSWNCSESASEKEQAELSPSEMERKEYVKSIEPAEGSTVGALDKIRVTFTNKAQAGNGKLTITDEAGKQVFSSAFKPSPVKDETNVMLIYPKITRPGVYTLTFNPSCVRVGGVPNTHSFSYRFTVAKEEARAKAAPVYLVAGQSNTDGRAPISDYPEDLQKYFREGATLCHWSYCNGTDWAWENFGGKMLPYKAYTDDNSISRCGFDGVIYNLIEQKSSRPFYVIKESKGGTAIDPECRSIGNLYWCADESWLADHSPRSGGSLTIELTDNITALVDRVLSKLDNGYDVRCIIWHQGCSDRAQSGRYKQNLATLVKKLRQTISEKTGEKRYLALPFIAGSVCSNSTQYNADVEKAKVALAKEDKNFHVVDLEGCELGDDSLHFSAKGNIEAAKRFYSCMNRLGLVP